MSRFELNLISLSFKKWDSSAKKFILKYNYVLDDTEHQAQMELSVSRPPDMVEEFIKKFKIDSEQYLGNGQKSKKELIIDVSNESFLRQKLHHHFRQILSDLNGNKKWRNQAKVISASHLEIYHEDQDISSLPADVQFYIILNRARRYYDREDYQQAIEPLRKMVRLKPDFGLGHKWLARSLKKNRKYEEAMRYYEKYAKVDASLDAFLDMAKSYRKGKLFDKSEKVYQKILNDYPQEKEAKIGLAQIKYARNQSDYISLLEDLHKENPEWLKRWLLEEFNFRIYVSPKSLLPPHQGARYLGLEKVSRLTQMAFRNEIPSHFNPSKARMSFYKEELENWALVMNRFKLLSTEIKFYPEALKNSAGDDNNGGSGAHQKQIKKQEDKRAEKDRSTKVEEIIRQIREARALREVQAAKLTKQGGGKGKAKIAKKDLEPKDNGQNNLSDDTESEMKKVSTASETLKDSDPTVSKSKKTAKAINNKSSSPRKKTRKKTIRKVILTDDSED
jgi:tetratricopeptide (TPR) repeat protein